MIGWPEFFCRPSFSYLKKFHHINFKNIFFSKTISPVLIPAALASIILFILLAHVQVYGQVFTEVSQEVNISHLNSDANILNAGVVLFDFNNDDFLDVFATGAYDSVHLYLNDTNGKFIDVTDIAGLDVLQHPDVITAGCTSGDFNNDGFIDLFVTTDRGADNFLFKNNGDNTFTDVSISSGIKSNDSIWSTSATFVDINLDGYLDLFVANYVSYSEPVFQDLTSSSVPLKNYLYINQKDGTFIEKSADYGLNTGKPTLAVTALDVNGDFVPDLLEVNDFSRGNNLFLNLIADSSRFYSVGDKIGLDDSGNFMGVAIGDINNDLKLDLFLADLYEGFLKVDIGKNDSCQLPDFNSTSMTQFFDNNELTVFWGTAFADIDNDADLDLIVSGGDLYDISPQPLMVFINNNGYFKRKDEDFGMASIGSGRGLATGDYDNDGDIDLFWAQTSGNPVNKNKLVVYRNDLSDQHNYVKVKLKGIDANPQGYHSLIYFYVGDKAYLRQVDGGSSYLSQNSTIVHLSLENSTPPDSIKIIWPGGKSQIEYNILPNTINTFTENMLDFKMESTPKELSCFFTIPQDTSATENPVLGLIEMEEKIEISITPEGLIISSEMAVIRDYIILNFAGKILAQASKMNLKRVSVGKEQIHTNLFIVHVTITGSTGNIVSKKFFVDSW